VLQRVVRLAEARRITLLPLTQQDRPEGVEKLELLLRPQLSCGRLDVLERACVGRQRCAELCSHVTRHAGDHGLHAPTLLEPAEQHLRNLSITERRTEPEQSTCPDLRQQLRDASNRLLVGGGAARERRFCRRHRRPAAVRHERRRGGAGAAAGALHLAQLEAKPGGEVAESVGVADGRRGPAVAAVAQLVHDLLQQSADGDGRVDVLRGLQQPLAKLDVPRAAARPRLHV